MTKLGDYTTLAEAYKQLLSIAPGMAEEDTDDLRWVFYMGAMAHHKIIGLNTTFERPEDVQDKWLELYAELRAVIFENETGAAN